MVPLVKQDLCVRLYCFYASIVNLGPSDFQIPLQYLYRVIYYLTKLTSLICRFCKRTYVPLTKAARHE